MKAPTAARTAAATRARRCATQDKLRRVEETLTRMRREKTPVTYPAVARRAGISRTFLYQNPDARNLMAAAATAAAAQNRRDQAEHDARVEASWQERALNAEEALKAARAEIRTQRNRIGLLLGQIRDTERDLTEEAVQRTTTENTTLKQRVREFTTENRTLHERLTAARSNARFADRRIAQLEAQLAQSPADTDRRTRPSRNRPRPPTA